MSRLLKEIAQLPEVCAQAQEILRVALSQEGREYLLDLFLKNAKRNEKRPAPEERGNENVFLRAKGLFNWNVSRQATMEERHPVKGSEKDGDAYVRYWEEGDRMPEEAITMILGYSEVGGGDREWELRVRRPRGVWLGMGESRLSLRSLLNRNMHDGLNGTPAEQEFAIDEGYHDWVVRLREEHHSHGVLWSPDENTPAVREFWGDGTLRTEWYLRDGRCLVRSEGRPNCIQYWRGGEAPARKTEQWRISTTEVPVPVPPKRAGGMAYWGVRHRPLNEGPAEIEYDPRDGREVKRSYYLMGEEVEAAGVSCLRDRERLKAGRGGKEHGMVNDDVVAMRTLSRAKGAGRSEETRPSKRTSKDLTV